MIAPRVGSIILGSSLVVQGMSGLFGCCQAVCGCFRPRQGYSGAAELFR